jgi:hypothetical protein
MFIALDPEHATVGTCHTTVTSALSKALSRNDGLDRGNNAEPYLASEDMKADANERRA